jgi:hypothetical protein
LLQYFFTELPWLHRKIGSVVVWRAFRYVAQPTEKSDSSKVVRTSERIRQAMGRPS